MSTGDQPDPALATARPRAANLPDEMLADAERMGINGGAVEPHAPDPSKPDSAPRQTLADKAGVDKRATKEINLILSSPTWVYAELPDGRLILRITLRQVGQATIDKITRGASKRDQKEFANRLLDESLVEALIISPEMAGHLTDAADSWIDAQADAGHEPVERDDEPDDDANELMWGAQFPDPDDDWTFHTIDIPSYWIENWIDTQLAKETITATRLTEMDKTATMFRLSVDDLRIANLMWVKCQELHGLARGFTSRGKGRKGKRRKGKGRKGRRKR